MKRCQGCKHFTSAHGRGLCMALDGGWSYHVDASTGRPVQERTDHPLDWRNGSPFRVTTEEMRQPGRPCGPDRLMYEPNFWRRLLARFT